MSRDYRLILGKISMDLSFAESFFENAEETISKFTLNELEKSKLLSLDKKRFTAYRENIKRSGDCDSCCNGGEPGGGCSECSASCCQ